MSDRSPKAIITDQGRAMQKAVANVFPNTRHRWCVWHIMKKLPEKLKSYLRNMNLSSWPYKMSSMIHWQ